MFVLWLLAFLPFAFAEVTELTGDEFETKVAEKEYTLVMFYAPWCGHCKHLKPHFEEASNLLAKSAPNVRLARLDCTTHGEKCSAFGVSGYPTVKLFKNGVFHKEYDGSRDAVGIRGFMMKHSQPASKKLGNVAEYNALLASDEAERLPVVVAFFRDEKDGALKAFQDFASDFISDALFAHTHEPKVLSVETDSHVRLHRPRLLASKLENGIVDYSGKVTTGALGDWMRKSQFGMVGYRSPQNEKFFPKDNLVVFYYNATLEGYPKGVNYYRNRLIKLLKNSLKPEWKLKFAYSPSGDYFHELSDLGYNNGQLPLVAIYSAGKKYKLEEYSPDTLIKFIDDFHAGALTPHIKSQPVPEPSNEAALTAVGTTFDEVVNDASKDVFIMFHAPWCGHCKNLMPKFKEAAEKLRSETGVRFVLYDATANDIPDPYTVNGYPTLYFVPKNSKKAPKLFQGPREVDDLIKYVAKESTEELAGYNREGVQKKAEL